MENWVVLGSKAKGKLNFVGCREEEVDWKGNEGGFGSGFDRSGLRIFFEGLLLEMGASSKIGLH